MAGPITPPADDIGGMRIHGTHGVTSPASLVLDSAGQDQLSCFLVFAAFFAAALRTAGPLVFAAFFAAAERLLALRSPAAFFA